MHEHHQVFLLRFSAVAKFDIFFLIKMAKRFKVQVNLPQGWRMQSLVGAQPAVWLAKVGTVLTRSQSIVFTLRSQLPELGQ